MTDNSQRAEGRGKVISALNMAINGLNIAKEATSTTPVNPIFGSVAVLLTMIRVSSFLSRDEMFQAHTVRTQWPTNRVTSISGCIAPISVKHSNVEWTERSWTTSVSRCVMRYTD